MLALPAADARSSSTTLRIFSSFLPCRMTLNPRVTSSAAVALPIPSVAPVTMAYGALPCRYRLTELGRRKYSQMKSRM